MKRASNAPSTALPKKKKRLTKEELCATVDSIAQEWLCPITQELPLNPVTAEDGRVYERSAIATWLKKRREAGQPIKSPVTNEAMGKRLFAAPQVRNTIKSMIQSGVLAGDIVTAWNERLKEKDAVAFMRRAAESGDGQMQHTLACNYTVGACGIGQDDAKAFKWFKRAAEPPTTTTRATIMLATDI